MTQAAEERRGQTEEERLIALAKEQFQRVIDAEQENRQYMLDDLRFAAASPDNHYQWPDSIRQRRETDPSGQRPCLTINKIPQHVNQVTNDIRQNRPQIKVLPMDDNADVETAEVLNGVIRHIQYISDADIAYDTAADNEVKCGVGYIRVLTDYANDESFEQEIFIRRVKNPFSVYMDPDIQMPDGSDAKFVFVTETVTREEFKQLWPDKQPMDWAQVGTGDHGPTWYQGNKVRIAEWYLIEQEKATLNLWQGGATTVGIPPELNGQQPIRSREIYRRKVMWRKICGHCVLEETEWAGRFIPIARAVGNEEEVDGKQIVSGLVRNAKDAQRMYNYWASQEVEMLALAPKAPFVGYAGQFEGFEHKWKTANTVNYPYLEANPVVDEVSGAVLPLPQRVVPPQPSAGIIQAKMGAADDIKATTGQYDASLGARGNETSGKAILARQREGDTGTFHFVDNLSRAIRHVGRIVVDLIPKIYDTPRIVRILGEDGETSMAKFDPSLPIAHQEGDDKAGIEAVYNPSVGRYDVAVTVGPSYTTKRQEAADAMMQMTQANPTLWGVIGDLLVRNMDWPGADDMAKRLKATLIPQVQQLEGGDDQQIPDAVKQDIMQAHQHMQEMEGQMRLLAQQLEEARREAQDAKDSKVLEAIDRMIKHYQAETERLKVMGPTLQPVQAAAVDEQLVASSLHSPSEPEQGIPL